MTKEQAITLAKEAAQREKRTMGIFLLVEAGNPYDPSMAKEDVWGYGSESWISGGGYEKVKLFPPQ